ncbi:MAG: hypothetical protein JO236_02840 [Mycobacterium sp.]|uniref:hypothetical protein n=1 Tax=Mycobacterium sp. TaxID=1785 RepID=UPI001EBB7215|nr:hypothetical protein [Mycobacterium sp.]MBW0016472.1 hypothetical protein [Mycobacterium sp.]
MDTTTRVKTSAAVFVLAASSTGMFAAGTAAAAPGVTLVVLDAYQRACDFSRDGIAPMTPRATLGGGTARIRTAGSQVIAEVQLVDAPDPGTHFDVELIQAPRPASAGCAPGQPGVAAAGMDTDASGVGTVTIQDTIRSGTTGVWVSISRPNEHSQNPAEAYTSEFVAPV